MSDRVVVIGDPNSVFVQYPVRYWRSLGIDAMILTARWNGPETVGGDLPVIAAESIAPPWVMAAANGLYPFLEAVNTSSLSQDPDRVRNALRAWAETAVPPSVAAPVFDALLIAAAANILEPACVLGHEAFAYGLATSMCTAPRRALVAWGADVLQYAPMTDVALSLVRQALHGVHYVLTNTMSMEDVLHERFGVPRHNVAHVSFGIDRNLFSRAIGTRADRIRKKYGIAPSARVVMNVRRFLPHWGSAAAWPAMLAVAEQHADVHLVTLGGPSSEPGLKQAAEDATVRGLNGRTTLMHGDVSLETVAELMSVADVSLSLVATLEPVSWSVHQAVACGSAVVVADQASYADEDARGLSVARVAPANISEAAAAIVALLGDEGRRAQMARDNNRYISAHHDRDAQMKRLLRIAAGSANAERLLTRGAARR